MHRAGTATGSHAHALAAALLAISYMTPTLAEASDFEVDLSDAPLPFLKSDDLPERAGPLIEFGRGMNEVGPLSPGIEMPWGVVWQPALWIYGSQRTHILFSDGDRRTRPAGDRGEIVTRMDLTANLQLTGTERVLVHLRPMDGQGNFTGRTFSPSAADKGFEGHWDGQLDALFFEGDLGEMFPLLDPQDRGQGDWGFAVGKFPVEFQDGYMVRDEMTAIGLSKSNVQLKGSSGLRFTGLWAFDDINESNGAEDARRVDLFGLFVEGDFPWGLLEVDVAATVSGRHRGNQINGGIGWTGHVGGNNYSARANISRHFGQTIDASRGLNVRPNGPDKDYDGALLTLGYSTELGLAHDVLYATGYWARGDFRRLASNGTPPLGPIGLSFAGAGLGIYRPALWPRALDSVGFALGVQKFFADQAGNWALELACRDDLEEMDEFGQTGGLALTTRFQYKIAKRMMVQIDAYHAVLRGDDLGPQDAEKDDDSWATRMEWRVNF